MAEKMVDRRFVLGAAVGATAGTAATAMLEFFDFLDTSDENMPLVLRRLREALDNEPSFPAFARAASDALQTQSGRWHELPSVAMQIENGILSQITALARDDYLNGRTVPVMGWMISRTEAFLLTFVLNDS